MRSSTTLLLFAVVMLAAPAGALAQARFAIGVDAGADIPLAPVARNTVRLSGAGTGDALVSGTPAIVDRLAQPGFHIGVSAHLSMLEIRYRYERFAWSGARQICEGDGEVTQLPNGEIEDAAVEYRCTDRRTLPLAPGEAGGAYNLHHIGIGPRLSVPIRRTVRVLDGELVERRSARVFGVVSGGPSVAHYTDPSLGRRVRFGLHAAIGGGAEVPIDRRLWLVFDVRYSTSLIAGASPPASRSTRAHAAGRNALSAIFDSGHRFSGGLGLRFDFR